MVGGYSMAIVDVPLLYETGADAQFDRVIVTICPPSVQLARLMHRGMTEAAARQRLAAQWPTERKAERADFVIETGGTFEETERQVEAVLRRLTSISD
jgi:dephospho-CoA kinase